MMTLNFCKSTFLKMKGKGDKWLLSMNLSPAERCNGLSMRIGMMKTHDQRWFKGKGKRAHFDFVSYPFTLWKLPDKLTKLD